MEKGGWRTIGEGGEAGRKEVMARRVGSRVLSQQINVHLTKPAGQQ